MDEDRKIAYRHLLYDATLEIRRIENLKFNPWLLFRLKELRRRGRQVVRAGGLAEWLHNLAMYSAEDFRGFREELFWKDHDFFVNRYCKKEFGPHADYRDTFERRLKELATKSAGN